MIGHFNAGSEWLDAFFNLGIKGNDVLYLAQKINELGSECSHCSCGVGVAFEAWEKGLLGPDQTDGLRFEWGNGETVDRLLDLDARREGKWGNLFADVPTEVAAAIGERLREALKIRSLTALNSLAAELAEAPTTTAASQQIQKLARSFDFDGLAAYANELDQHLG